MAQAAPALEASPMEMQAHASSVWMRTAVIGLTAFLTVVDLFATQAILPSLARAYQVDAAAMGFAVNASTMGMTAAGLAIALLGRRCRPFWPGGEFLRVRPAQPVGSAAGSLHAAPRHDRGRTRWPAVLA